MNVVRAIIGIGGSVLLGLMLWAALAKHDLHGDLQDQLAVLATLPWGLTALVDLYLGFVLFAVLVFLTERTWIAALFWAAPIFVLGNFWAALWLVVRLPHLAGLLRRNWPAS